MNEGGTSLDENFFSVFLFKYMGNLKPPNWFPPPLIMGEKRSKITHFPQKSFEISHLFEQQHTEKILFQTGSPLIHGREAFENDAFFPKIHSDFPYIFEQEYTEKFSSKLVPPSFMGGKQVKMKGFVLFPKNPLRSPIHFNSNTLKKFSPKLVPPSVMGGKQVKMTHFSQKIFEISHIWEISKDFFGKRTNLLNFTCFPPMNEGGTSLEENFFSVFLFKYMGNLKEFFWKNDTPPSFSLASRP